MKYLYLIVAILLLLCLAPMPFGFYQLVRFVAMVVFIVFACNYLKKRPTAASYYLRSISITLPTIHKNSPRQSNVEHSRRNRRHRLARLVL